MSSELQELKKRLRDQKKATDTAEVNSKKYHDTLEKTKGVLSNMLSDFHKALGDDNKEIKKEKVEVNGEN